MNLGAKIIILCELFVCARFELEQNMVNIPSLGVLAGKADRSYFSGRTIHQYLGVNYAKAPSKDRRFKPPEETGPWEGVYNATKMRQKCPQIDLPYYPNLNSSLVDAKDDVEDCLVVNVFTPSVPGRTQLSNMPVMFYIHGGSFWLGSAYDFLPDFLLEKDIVLVVPQYRLGLLGFLFLNTTEIPGNVGMMDILSALRWVKRHIQHFGGDPSKITVVGQSAGAAAASSLLVSPLVEKDLFDKMIIQSGSILGTWTVDDDPIKSTIKISEILGCSTEDVGAVTECLKNAPVEDLIKAHSKYVNNEIASGGKGIGGSSLVVQAHGENNFLVEHPEKAYREGSILMVPIMGGTTRDEGTSFLTSFYDNWKLENVTDKRYFQRNITRDILKFFGYNDPYGVLTDCYHNTYFRGGKSLSLKEILPGLIDICGVLLIKESTYDVLRVISYSSKAYVYSFNFYGNISKLRASEPRWDSEYPFPAGVAHSDELGYLFPSGQSDYTERELRMVRIMMKFWTNFIIHGAPSLPGDDIEWPEMSTPFGPYLRISDELQVRESFYDEFTVNTREGFPKGSAPSVNNCGRILFMLISALTLLHRRTSAAS